MPSTPQKILEAQNRAIQSVTVELLEYYSQPEVMEWWATPIIGEQNPLQLLKEGRARFLTPFVQSMIDARKNG